MTRNYRTPTVADQWAEKRDTHMAVAVAIHAIAADARSPEAIWAAPTQDEWDHVCAAVDEYVLNGDFTAEPDGYCWGEETVPNFGGFPE